MSWDSFQLVLRTVLPQTYLCHFKMKEVLGCDLYVGIFYMEHSDPTLNEFSIARPPEIPVLVFEKNSRNFLIKLRTQEAA